MHDNCKHPSEYDPLDTPSVMQGFYSMDNAKRYQASAKYLGWKTQFYNFGVEFYVHIF